MRSSQPDRSRLALTLNRSVEVAGHLTSTDYSVLSLIFRWRYTRDIKVSNRQLFEEYMLTKIAPFAVPIGEANASCEFLEAMQCASIQTGTVNFHRLTHGTYGGAFSKGFTEENLLSYVPEAKRDIEKFRPLLIPAIEDESRLQIRAINMKTAAEMLEESTDLTSNEAKNVAALFESTFMTPDEINVALAPKVPNIAELQRLWDDTNIAHSFLTPIGKAIAHANVTRLDPTFRADLSVWVQ